MPNVAAIDAITGPGRRTLLFEGDIQDITFRLKKKIIEITNNDGSMGQYDLAQVSSINVSSDGDNFTVSVTSVPKEDTDERTKRDDRTELDKQREEGTRDDVGATRDKDTGIK